MSQSYTRGTPIDTDPTLAANSDLVAPSQAAVVAYVTNAVGAGGVVSVTATPPVVSTGGINPTISMLQATGLQDGYLTSTDWNTFNNKVSTIGVIDSVVKSANGAVVSGSSIFMQTADGTFPGLVSTGVQTFAGSKTFSSAPTFSTMTLGSVLFAGTGGLVSQDNTNFFWDNTNKRLGIRKNTPSATVHILGAGTTSATSAFLVENSAANGRIRFRDDRQFFVEINDTGGPTHVLFSDSTQPTYNIIRGGRTCSLRVTSGNEIQIIDTSVGFAAPIRIGSKDILYLEATNDVIVNTSGALGARVKRAQFFGATGNLLLQNGGTFTDAGFRLDVNGTFRSQGDVTISDTRNIILATGTGTTIGTATNQKLSFWNATPQSQPVSGSSINGVLDALGLRASGGIANFSADIDISKYNIITDNTVGTKVATDPGQWLSFWNAAPGPQPDLSVPSASFSSTGGTTITDTDTFDGYTIAQVVAALRQVGLLA